MARTTVDFVIANGETTSNAQDLSEYDIVGFQIGTFTGATFSFLARATEADTYVAVVDNAGNAVSVTATDDRYIVLDEEPMRNLSGLRWVKIVSASSEAAARTVRCVLRRSL